MLSIGLSGCYMAPLALLGPAASGFSSTSILQATLTTTTNALVKKRTGKTIGEHTMESINQTLLAHGYVSIENYEEEFIYPQRKPKKEI